MAFNKGLQIVDSNTATRNSISLEELDKGIFQSSSTGASGSAVFTVRPATNDDAAGAYQEILKGQNLVVGIQYNATGDQYRLVVQNRVDFDANGAASSGAGFGSYVAVNTETTFGLTYSDNGTVMLQQSGGRLQTLDIGSWTAPTAKVVLEENSIAVGDVGHLILDDQKGNLIDIRPAALGTTTADDLLNAIVTAFDALDDVDTAGKAGFSLAVASNQLTITRTDKADFKYSFGEDVTGNILKNTDSGISGSSKASEVFLKIANVTTGDNYDFDIVIGVTTLTMEHAAVSGQTAADVVSALKTDLEADGSFSASNHEVLIDPTNSDVLIFREKNGAPFTIVEDGTADYVNGDVLISGENNPPLSTETHNDGASAVEITNITKSGASTHTSDLLSRDFDGFISQVAVFDIPLSQANLSSYVNTPSTIPSPTIGSDASATSVVLDLYGDAAQNTKKYGLILDAGNGNTVTIADQTAADATEAALLTQINTAFSGLSSANKKGFAVDNSVAGQLTISRADGADFTVTPSATTDYITTGLGQFRVDGKSLNKIDGENSLLLKVNNVTASDVYDFNLTGSGITTTNFAHTAAASGNTTTGVADALVTSINNQNGFTATIDTSSASVVRIARADGAPFSFAEDGTNSNYVNNDIQLSLDGTNYQSYNDGDAAITVHALNENVSVIRINQITTDGDIFEFTVNDGSNTVTPTDTTSSDTPASVALTLSGLVDANANYSSFSLGNLVVIKSATNTAFTVVEDGTNANYDAGDVSISADGGLTFAVHDDGASAVSSAPRIVANDARGELTSASTIAPASADLELVNAYAASQVGEVYAFTVEDGNAANAVSVSTFVPGNTANNEAIIAALRLALDPDSNGTILNDGDGDGSIDDDTGFRVSLDPTTKEKLTISRADGTNFTVKLQSSDEAANLKFKGTAVDADTGVTTVNGSNNGQVAAVSNNVVQNFDFSAITTGVDAVTSKGPSDGFTGAATIELHGLAKSDGSSLVQLGTTQGFAKAVSSGYEGAAVVSSGGTASDVLYVQLRDVEAQGNGRKMTADIFVDPALLGDDAYQALSYKVKFSSELTLESFTQMTTTGGFDLIDTTSETDTVAARWFQPTAVTDFSQAIATIVLVDDATGTTNPSFTFSDVDVDGTDFTDNSTYALSFVDTLDANLIDIGDRLVHGNNETTGVAGELVAVEASTGTTVAPTPTSGLYMTLSDWSPTASSANPNVTFDLDLKTATATSVISFEVDLPAGASATTFTLDPALVADWTVATNQVNGRTLIVNATGTVDLAAGGTLGSISSTVANSHGSASHFELTNVQTDADAANESGRGVYVGTATTKTSTVAADVGKWQMNDLPVGVMSRYYEGARDIAQSQLTAADALHALQISAGLAPSWYTGSSLDGQELAADFDGSGKVTAADALAILQASVADTLDARATWKFFDNETTTLSAADVATNLKVLKADASISANNLSLNQGDMVVLVGDLSDPSIG